jgi:translation initiation factor 3 subunit I
LIDHLSHFCFNIESKEPIHLFNPIGSKATVCAFVGGSSNLIVTGHESGKVALFDMSSGEEVQSNERAHGEVVTDLQMHPDRTYFITSSKDKSARVSPHAITPGTVTCR